MKKIEIIIWILILEFLVADFFIYPQDFTDVYWEQIELYRDNWGVPHIFATNPRALGFGFGYAQAEDHWESMLLSYRLANGRLGEVLGEKEEESDKLSLQLGHKLYGVLAYQNCDMFTKELCEGFAEGVNAWILEHREKLPAWVDGVQPQDIFALWHAFLVSLAPLDSPTLKKRPPGLKSSFAFALSSQKSLEGLPLFALSAHQYYTGPFRWYECHLICGDYNVYGCTLYGLPLILMGHSTRHAWAIVPNQSDFADVFIETPIPGKAKPKSVYQQDKIDEEQSLLFLKYMSQAEPYYVATPYGVQQRFVPVQITSKGPIFLEGNKFFTWKIGGFEDVGIFTQLWEMGRAKSCEQFVSAVWIHQLPCFHILYADNSNQLYYIYSSKAGTREPSPGLRPNEAMDIQNINWHVPVLSKFYSIGWRYLIPPEQLPSILNPPSGYIQVCGGPPDITTDNIQFPNYDILKEKLIMDVENVVSRRVRGYLRTEKRSFEEVQSLLLDPLSALALEVIPKIVDIADKHKQSLSIYHPDLPYAVELLSRWNLITDPKSVPPTIFQLWTHFFTDGLSLIPSIDVEPFASLMDEKEGIEEHCLESLANAVRYLRNIRGSANITWGEVHKIQRGAREYSIGGSEAMGCTYILSEHPPIDENWGKATYGVGFAMVCALGNSAISYTVVPFGVSEEQNSKHFNDQWELFSQRQMKKTRFLPTEIYSNSEVAVGRKLVLSPEIGIGEIRCVSSSKISIRVRSEVSPPEELPDGLINFTMFHIPEYTPTNANVEFLVKLAVPPDICAPENMPNLAIYEFREGTGWKKLIQQDFNYDLGIFEGTFNGKTTFCVLGPSKYLLEKEDSDKSTDVNKNRARGMGIFSRGLPGETPLERTKKEETNDKTYFWKVPTQEVLPEPKVLPPAENTPRKEEGPSSDKKNKGLNYSNKNEMKDDAVSKSEKTRQERNNKFDKRYVRRNFTIKKKSSSND